MNDAIEQRVEQFVQEMLGVLQEARGVSCAAALKVVSTMLGGVGQPPPARTSAERRPLASRGARTPTKAATSPKSAGSTPRKKPAPSPKRRSAIRRGTRFAASEAVVPSAVAAPGPASASAETETPVTPRTPPPMSAAPAPNVAPASAATTSSAPAAPVPEREALVLDAVRALGRATAGEVAARSGQPNGTVGVALRGLVARGQVVKTRTTHGAEYSLVSTGS